MRCVIVEDDPAICFMVEQAVAHVGCESMTVASLADALQQASAADGPGLAIVGHAPPRSDAVAWCESLRSSEAGRACHVLLLVAPGEAFDLRRATDAGIDDLLVKPFQAIELELRVRAAVRLVELRGQLDAVDRAWRAETMRDPLTGVLNEPAIMSVLRQECARAGRDGTPLAVILAEVDDLDSVSEWHGSGMADAVLGEVASRMHSILRVYDGLGRAGHAGFLATLPKCEVETAGAVADRIRALVASVPVEALGRTASVTVSIGVRRPEAAHEGRADRLVSDAVAAARRARAAGGNRVETASA